jgi:hypothetical protein
MRLPEKTGKYFPLLKKMNRAIIGAVKRIEISVCNDN